MNKQTQKLIIAIVPSAIVLASAAMANVYGLIPMWVMALLSLGIALLFFVVSWTGKIPLGAPTASGNFSRPAWLIWPIALVVGGALGIVNASEKGWDSGDIVGAIVCLILFVLCVFAYRKLRNKGPSA